MTKNYEILAKKISELEELANEIQEMGIKLLEAASIEKHASHYSFKNVNYKSVLRELQRVVGRKYQLWYSSSFTLIEEYTPQWLENFSVYYKRNQPNMYDNGVRDYLDLDVYCLISNRIDTSIKDKIINDFIRSFEKQIAILLSIPSCVQTKEINLRKIISADLAKTEIEEAEILLAEKHYRAAGTIAGVALELHLKTTCDINTISYPPKATLDPLAQALYKSNKIDIIELKHIQYLAAIRNKCSHPNIVPEEEVKKLIEEVKKLV